jgi:hypothetical protein
MSERRERLHPAKAGALTLALGIVALAGTGVAVVRTAISDANAPGLQYSALTSELNLALRSAPADDLLRVDTAVVELAGRRETYDTLVVIADTTRFPAFREGGFLADQVALFNRYQNWRVEVGHQRAEWFDSLSMYNPSVFRTGRAEDGRAIPLRSASTYAMRVTSPFEELWRGRVIAREFQESPGLVGQSSALSLARTSDSLGSAASVPCRTDRSGSTIRFFCVSREGRPQLSLRLASHEDAATARAGWSPTGYPFRYDGRPLRAGDTVSVVDGGIVALAGVMPSIFSRIETGLLSGTQWINGRVQRVTSGPEVLHFLSGLGARTAAQNARGGGDVRLQLSIDAALSQELADSLATFTRGLPLDFAAVLLADAKTGEIRGLGEHGARTDPDESWFLRPVNVGSAIKPILATAILSERPELASLEIHPEATVDQIFGYKVGGFASDTHGCPAQQWIDLAYFIRCSNNQFAAAITLAGIADATPAGFLRLVPGNTEPFRLAGKDYSALRPSIPMRGGRVPKDWLTGSALSNGLLRVFNVDADVAVADARARNDGVWRGLRFSNGIAARPASAISPEVSRPSLVARGTNGTGTGLLATYAYGGWGNQWTMFDLTQAFDRIVTDRRVVLSFAAGGTEGEADPTNEDETSGESLKLSGKAWYRTLTTALSGVAESGTAAGLSDSWRSALGNSMTVYAKTGTLNETDDKLYLKTLVFAVGRKDDSADAALGCGMVGTIYFRLKSLPQDATTVPPLATTFATRVLGPMMARYWSQLRPCPVTRKQADD